MLDAVLESEDGPTSDHKSARRQRIEVITRGELRRRWTVEQKRDIALESLEPGTSPIIVARKHGISSGQLYTWRQQLLRDAVGAAADMKPSYNGTIGTGFGQRFQAANDRRPPVAIAA